MGLSPVFGAGVVLIPHIESKDQVARVTLKNALRIKVLDEFMSTCVNKAFGGGLWSIPRMTHYDVL